MFNEINSLIQDNSLMVSKRYTLKDFLNIDNVLQKLNQKQKNGYYKEFKKIKKQKKLLEDNRYIYIILAYEKGEDFQSEMNDFIRYFEEHKRYNYILHLLDRMLKIKNNLNILKLKLKYNIKSEATQEKILEIKKEILKLNFNDYSLIEEVAGLNYHLNNYHEAIHYYKIVFTRYFEIKDEFKLKEVLYKLVDLKYRNESFYISFLRNINIFSNKKFIHDCYKMIFLFFYKEKDVENSLNILSQIVENEIDFEEDFDVRKYILQMIDLKYSKNKNLKNILDLSKINKNWGDLKISFQIFNKLIHFDIGVFVFHDSFGYGVVRELGIQSIRKIDNVDMVKVKIDFQRKKNHQMSLRIANNSLKILSKHNLYSIYFFNSKEMENIKNISVNDLIKKIFITLDDRTDIVNIKNLINDTFEENQEEIFKKVKLELDTNNKYLLKNKKYQVNDDSSSILMDQYENLNETKEKLYLAYFIYTTYPMSSIVLRFNKDIMSLLEDENNQILVLLYAKYFQNRSKEISLDLQSLFNEYFSNSDMKLFDSLKNPLGKIYMDFLTVYDKKNKYIKDIYYNYKSTQRFYYIDLMFSQKKYNIVLESLEDHIKVIDSKIDNYLELIDHIFKYLDYYKGIDILFIYNTLVDQLDKYYRLDDFGSKHYYNRIKNLLFNDLFYEYLENGDISKGLQILDRLFQYVYLDDYLKLELRELENKMKDKIK